MSVVKWTFEDYYSGLARTTTFRAVGAMQQFVVPDDVSQVRVYLRGAPGGGELNDWGYAVGGVVRGVLDVDPGDTLYVYVGGPGLASSATGFTGAAGGWNGGGRGGDKTTHSESGGYSGGGASDIRVGGTALTDRAVVAGGGGGSSGGGHRGAGGGDRIGGNAPCGYDPLGGGRGGTQTAGGAHGTSNGFNATNGALGVGGRGSDNNSSFGTHGAGGGGGGFYGGGGGGLAHPDTGNQIGDLEHIFAYGGGGGSNFTGGLSPDYTITSSRGDYAEKGVRPAFPNIRVSWAPIGDAYEFEINPNDGGTPSIQKNLAIATNVGPNRVNIVQEGQSQAPTIDFSGVILDQQQLESLESWFDRRAFMKVTDDLGREYYGVFSKFTPKRVRRASNPWYHTYDAEFTASAYKNASGDWIYGRIV
jgi:hypothetical protein